MMKKIGVVIPTYNEEGNVCEIHRRLTEIFQAELPQYDYEILFIDNKSTDSTREKLERLCRQDSHVKSIFNIHNFDFRRSSFYGLTQSDGDATFLINADMQDPPELLPAFVEKWESGKSVVIGIKSGSRESLLLRCMRKFYYWVIKLFSESEQIANFNGFGLYDQSFIKILRQLNETDPYLKGIVADYASEIEKVSYEQRDRKEGKGTTNFFRMYDFAMSGITSTSKIILRMCTMIGFMLAIISLIVAISVIVSKFLHWEEFQLGMAAMSTGVFFLGSVQLFFIGIMGEYVLAINTKAAHRPLIIEERRINFEATEENEYETKKSL